MIDLIATNTYGDAAAWIKAPNTASVFRQHTPLETMLEGEDGIQDALSHLERMSMIVPVRQVGG